MLLLAYAQKNEFEESIEQLKQEIVDQAEDRKIGEKKTHSLIKDLKKQLLSEKQRNEKLSDKIKEHFEPPSTLSDASQLEADRTSNSSWSIYSGQIEVKIVQFDGIFLLQKIELCISFRSKEQRKILTMSLHYRILMWLRCNQIVFLVMHSE